MPTNSTTNLEPSASDPSLPIRIIPQPVTEELKNRGKTNKNLYGRGGERGQKPKGICKIKLQPRLHLTVLRNVKPWILSANVQDEVQTIYFIFIYFKTDAVALYFIIQDFQRRQTEFLQPN